ncbi:MAG: hypothetical protein AOA66_1324 [Candidatus Bathyarchaeota archaeon BA2]|nr:MAG: hypothetical protein AOA66_1324 [Candidatus Bathyarchaeota archaeon BA2]
MGLRRILAAVVGTLQAAMGVSAVIFACFLYIDFLNVQSMLNISQKPLSFYLLVLTIFSFLSIISGLFLVFEGLER